LATKIRTEGFLNPDKKVVMLGIAGFKIKILVKIFVFYV
jgi:hypothetical protein